MTNKQRRGGLGRGLGALIPTAPVGGAGGPSAVPGSVAAGVDATPADTVTTSGASTGSADRSDSTSPEVASDGRPDRAEGSATLTQGEEDRYDAAVVPVPGASFRHIPIAAIHANPKQPRQVFDEDALAELAHSISEFGVLQPVVVRTDGDAFELVMGERRLRAAGLAGLESMPAIVRDTADDAMLRDALLENIHRAQLNPLEEAAAYQQLLEEFGVTHDELAGRIGRSRPQVSNTIRLLNLPVSVQRRVAAGVLSAGHARALLGLDDGDQQDELAARIVAEGLSVRATEELVTLASSGGLRKPARRAVAPRISAPAAAELAERLSDLYDTRVRVDLGRRKGRISVEFASINDLERIVAVMAPQLSPRSATSESGLGGGPTSADTSG